MPDPGNDDNKAKDTGIFENPSETRLLQNSPSVIKANHQKLQKLGVYNIVKVAAFSASKRSDIRGYITAISEISGKTAAQMERHLGLKAGTLGQGADIYRPVRIPREDEILPRGYSSLPDGLVLKPQYQTDSAGFPRGQMAWQVTLKKDVAIGAVHLGSVRGTDAFDPGTHPDTARLYPEHHPARKTIRK